MQANPFRDASGAWNWRDERDRVHGPYPSQMTALRDLLNHIDPESGIPPAPIAFTLVLIVLAILVYALVHG